MNLRIVNPYRHPGAVRSLENVCPDGVRQLLMQDLDALGQLAREAPKNPRVQRQFLNLLSPRAPVPIRRFEPGWESALRDLIEADREELRPPPPVAPLSVVADLPARAWSGTKVVFSAAQQRAVRDLAAWAESECSDLKWSRRGLDPAERRSWLQVRLDQLARECPLPGVQIVRVKVCPDPGTPGDVMISWWPDRNAPQYLLLLVRASVLPIRVAALLCFRVRDLRRARLAMRTFLNAATPPGLVLRATALLARFLCQPGFRPWLEVAAELQSNPQHNPSLLGELVWYRASIRPLASQDPVSAAIARHLPGLVQAAGWDAAASSVLPVLEALQARPSDECALTCYRALWTMARPVPENLHIVAAMAQQVRIPGLYKRPLAQALLACLAPLGWSEGAGNEIRAMLDPGATAAPRLDGVKHVLAEALSTLRTGPELVKVVRQIGDAAQPAAAIGVSVVPLLEAIAVVLAERMPECDDGVWQLRGQQADFLEALEEFIQVAAQTVAPRWRRQEMEILTTFLPQDHAGRVARFPASFWPAAKRWLSEPEFKATTLDPLAREIGLWVWDAFWGGSHEARQAQLGRTAPICRLGGWLACFACGCQVRQAIVARFVGTIGVPAFNADDWQDGLRALSQVCHQLPDLSARMQTADVLFALAPWNVGLRLAWLGWLQDVLTHEQNTWRVGAGILVLRGLLRDTPNAAAWQKALESLNPAWLAAPDWDDCLGEFEATLSQRGIPAPVVPGLAGLGAWVARHAPLVAARWQAWSSSSQPWSNQGWLPWRERTLLLTAALRRQNSTLLATRVRSLWPELPSAMLCGQNGDLQAFIGACTLSECAPTPAMEALLTSHLATKFPGILHPPPSVPVADWLGSAGVLLRSLPECAAVLVRDPAFWPAVPASLLLQPEEHIWRKFLRLPGLIKAVRKEDEWLRLRAAHEVLGRLSPDAPASLGAVAKLATTLFGPGFRATWDRVAALGASGRVKLCLAQALLCTPGALRQATFINTVLRECAAAGESNLPLVAEMAGLLKQPPPRP
jgi:hypothetical protein